MNNNPTGFIKFLVSLDEKRDTASFAKLRRGVGDSLEDLSADIGPYLSPFVATDDPEYSRFALAGALFAGHRRHADSQESLGRAYSSLGESDSLEQRFKSLLRSRGDELIPRLREAVSLLKAKDTALDYVRLLYDLRDWDDAAQPIQFRWARDYWRGVGDTPATPDTFIARLAGLKNDRAARAALRRGLGKKLGDIEMLPYVAPFLPEKSRDYPVYFLVAALFGQHPLHTDKEYYNLGAVYRDLIYRRGGEEHAQSLVKRFIALLDADFSELPHHLRQAVDLAETEAVAVNYRQLLQDLLYWGHADKTVQQRWAESFWTPRKAA